jgi:PKD repeat protein
LKAKKQDRNLRELFRHKLEYAELIPDPSVGSELMNKLAVREFLHFSPSRFNVYYLGGIVAAVATVLVLASQPARKDHPPSENIINQIPVTGKSFDTIIIPEPIHADIREGGKVKKSDSRGNITFNARKAEIEKAESSGTGLRVENNKTQALVTESLKGKELFSRNHDDKYKLQERIITGEYYFEASVSEGCAPLKVIFKNKLSDTDSCLWTFGDGGSSGVRNPEWIYDVEGEYRVVLNVIGQDGTTSSFSSVISVFPKPTARFEIAPDKVAIPEEEVRFQNYSSAAVKYLWSFGDGITSEQFEPFHRYEKYGNYNVSLKVFSENGCSDSLTVLNAFSGSAYYIEFPNAFIPNTGGPSGGVYSSKSDESAQVFHPSFSGISEYHLKIFSKMGVLIFETTDINVGWDGYFKGQLSNPGVYIWKVRGNFSNGEPFTKMGDVTLLKN